MILKTRLVAFYIEFFIMQGMNKRKLVLASSSPRRKELLERAGLTFIVDAANIEEDMTRKLAPDRLVKKLAFEKASFVALRHPNAIVIGADTIVSIGRNRWSKPANLRQAKMMLRALNGKTHVVWTGFCIIDTTSGKRAIKSVKTNLTLRKLTKKEIARYLETGEPLDGAGGYKLQEKGQALMARIDGDYNNILGLPLSVVLDELKKMGVRV